MMQKAYIEAFRAMVISTFYLVDIKNHHSDKETVKQAKERIEIYTPPASCLGGNSCWKWRS